MSKYYEKKLQELQRQNSQIEAMNRYYSASSDSERRAAVADALTTPTLTSSKKKASVVGRSILGGILGGGPGAAIGAMSAIEENKKNK